MPIPAISAYYEAFSTYKRNILPCALFSFATFLFGTLLGAILLAAGLVLGAFSIGGVLNALVSGKGFSLEIAGMLLTSLVVAAGFVIFLLVQGGLSASFVESLYILHSGRKQTLFGLFYRIPRYAASMLALGLLSGAILLSPIAAGLILSFAVGWGIAGIAIMTSAVLVSLLMSLFFIFTVPSLVVDEKGALEAIRRSAAFVVKNFGKVAIFVVISSLLWIPSAIPIAGVLYLVLAYVPITQIALLALYKQEA
ncbi:MAG: hypothetical protein N3F07_00490 [Candidatus Micrarchaeota archaeon]|nr:hypothetical protein [Candidatus Micrarchaeota archaeon]